MQVPMIHTVSRKLKHFQAINWAAGVTPLELESKDWKCWGARPTIADAQARLKHWDSRSVAMMLVLQITITAIGLTVMANNGSLEIMQFPEQKMRIYGSLHSRCLSQTGELLYTVEAVTETGSEVLVGQS